MATPKIVLLKASKFEITYFKFFAIAYMIVIIETNLDDTEILSK